MTTSILAGLWLALAVLVTITDWRVNLVALMAHYLGAALLLTQIVLWPVALARVLTGVGVVAILFLTGRVVNFGFPRTGAARPRFRFPTGFPFRVMALVLVSVAAWYTASQPAFALPSLSPGLNTACYLLMALGLLTLGLTEEPFNAGMGLFMAVSGFHLFYAAIEPSLAIAALLAAVDFGIALAVSYLALVWHGAASREAAG